MTLYLLKPGELTLKGNNRKEFEHTLRRNLAKMLQGSGARVFITKSRFFIHCPEHEEEKAEYALRHVFGIAGWAKTKPCEKNIDSVIEACVEEARLFFEKGKRTFKIEARRTDKSFPLDSYAIRCAAGDAVIKAIPEYKVDVKKPELVINVEIREKAYVYANAEQGLRGLPTGTAGRGLVLLSGGIDSPVAAYMMASRGMSLDAIYFHAWPFTSDEAKQKTKTLAGIVNSYCLGLRLYIVDFAAVQKRIKENAPEAWITVLLRMTMVECANILAKKKKLKCLISGESLSQVASQTIENIACTQSTASIPVLRPLIGMNKEQIIRIAETIGTFKTSILPYDDCCTLFTPPHPVLRGNVDEAKELYAKLELHELLDKALEKCEIERM